MLYASKEDMPCGSILGFLGCYQLLIMFILVVMMDRLKSLMSVISKDIVLTSFLFMSYEYLWRIN